MYNKIFKPSEKINFSDNISDKLILFIGNGQILIKKQSLEEFSILIEKETTLNLKDRKVLELGFFGKNSCGAILLEEKFEYDVKLFEVITTKEALDFIISNRERTALSRALELNFWLKNHNYCGACGEKLENSLNEHSRICRKCKAMFFPVIAPAVITAIIRDDKILLAHNSKFRENLYSLIAGFVEAGESLEEAVEREIYEEVKIRVKNIKYFGSQAWPFPNSIMFGFTAEYDSGEISPDKLEILDAKWCTIDDMPLLPSNGSIARKIIDSFVSEQKSKLNIKTLN